MDCCPSTTDETSSVSPDVPYARLPVLSRRTLLKGAAGLAGAAALAGCGGGGGGGGDRIQLAFCSQLLCVVPYEVTVARGFFADEGLDVELVYSRGGGAALQALVSGAVDCRDLVRRRGAGVLGRRGHPPVRLDRAAAAVRAGHRPGLGGRDR